MGISSIASLVNTGAISLLPTFCETISVSAFFGMSRALERARTPRGVLTQILDLHAGGFNLESGSWWAGSEGKKQLEAELAGRLWAGSSVGEAGQHIKKLRDEG